MADNDKICEYSEEHSGRPLNDPCRLVIAAKQNFGYKKVYKLCPKCKRKLQCWATVSSDGEILAYNIPRHKRKKWWKKKGRKK